jgi:LPXTG-motif cell wall-anchored protein
MKWIFLLGCSIFIGWLMIRPHPVDAATSKTVTMVIHHETKSETTGSTRQIDGTVFTVYNVDKPFKVLPDMDGETSDERKGRFAGGYFIGRIPGQDLWKTYSGPWETATRKGVKGVTKEIKLARGHIYLVAHKSDARYKSLPAVIQINSKTVPYFHLYPKSSRGWLPDTDWIFGDELPATDKKPKKPKAITENWLPKTGEQIGIGLSILGIFIVIIAMKLYDKRYESVVKIHKYSKRN